MVPPCSDRVSRAPPYSISSRMPFRVPGYHRLRPAFPDRSAKTCVTFGLLPVRSSLLGESRLISVPPGTEIFQFSGFALRTYAFSTQYPCGWVSPFGHRRIHACCQLPDAFRRLPRPSSPLTAKASTVCASSLDPITPSRLRVGLLPPYLPQRHALTQQSQDTCHFPIVNEPHPASTRNTLAITYALSRSGGSGRTRTTGLTLIRGAL